MVDKYPNFKTLAESESEGRDYAIRYADRGSRVLVLGPHAGAIELGTTGIVLAVAAVDLSFYLFKGIKKSGNRYLHITSTNFDEPCALDLVKNSEIALAIHGEGSDNSIVYLGGGNESLIRYLQNSLNEAGFDTDKHDNPHLQGTSSENICNRCASASGGVQLELGKGLREKFFKSLTSQGRKQPTKELNKFAKAVREGLDNATRPTNRCALLSADARR